MSGDMSGALDTSSLGPLNDVKLDYYAKRAAVAAANENVVHIWDVTDVPQKAVAQLRAHEGPLWKVAWAHPKYGSLLATCGYDMKVIIWKEVQPGNWQIAFMDTTHMASVNSCEFCPWEFGLRLACASSDGTVSILTHQTSDQQWRRVAFPAHAGGALAVSWGAVQLRDGVMSSSMRLVSGGFDNSVYLWKCECGKMEGEAWQQETPLLPPFHTDWVRDVAWRPDSSTSMFASGSWDKTVVIWAQEVEGQPWRQACKLTMAGKVEALSWSVTGSVLAVSFGDGSAVLCKEAYDGNFEVVGKVSETGFTEVPNSLNYGTNLNPNQQQAQAPVEEAQQKVSLSSELQAQQQAVLDSFGMT